jgi:hypothetical protein
VGDRRGTRPQKHRAQGCAPTTQCPAFVGAHPVGDRRGTRPQKHRAQGCAPTTRHPVFVGAHPVGDSPLNLWEPTPWAIGVAHAPKSIAHRVRSYNETSCLRRSPPRGRWVAHHHPTPSITGGLLQKAASLATLNISIKTNKSTYLFLSTSQIGIVKISYISISGLPQLGVCRRDRHQYLQLKSTNFTTTETVLAF